MYLMLSAAGLLFVGRGYGLRYILFLFVEIAVQASPLSDNKVAVGVGVSVGVLLLLIIIIIVVIFLYR